MNGINENITTTTTTNNLLHHQQINNNNNNNVDELILNNTFIQFIGQYVDLDYSIWLWRVLTPLIITFLLPLIFVLLIYISCLFLYIYKLHRRVILQAVSSDVNFWNVARKCLAALWDAHSWIYHGYEVTGLEHLPINGPALIVYYHGAIPIDMYYFVARICLVRDRLIHTVGDRFLFKLPGWGILSESMKVFPGTIQTCSKILKEGNLLAISPGGVYEAQFGNNNYELLWKKRIGFAKVAIEAKVPIIPMFTENLREAFRSVGFLRRWFLKVYNLTRIPVLPVYGGFPVKFRTHLGPPIEYDPAVSAEELQEKVALAIEELIQQHQRIPGSILHALSERFIRKRKKT